MNAETPHNFSWLEERKIAGLAFPNSKESLEYLVLHGIRYLVTTSKEMQPNSEGVSELVNINICVEDYGTFNLDQINAFITICKNARREGKVNSVSFRRFFKSAIVPVIPRV